MKKSQLRWRVKPPTGSALEEWEAYPNGQMLRLRMSAIVQRRSHGVSWEITIPDGRHIVGSSRSVEEAKSQSQARMGIREFGDCLYGKDKCNLCFRDGGCFSK